MGVCVVKAGQDEEQQQEGVLLSSSGYEVMPQLHTEGGFTGMVAYYLKNRAMAVPQKLGWEQGWVVSLTYRHRRRRVRRREPDTNANKPRWHVHSLSWHASRRSSHRRPLS